MYSFFIGLLILLAGYLLYGKLAGRLFGADPNISTPATTQADGVDYVPINWKKAFLIEFLNIAGLGPIFGAILGATYGPVAFIWIAFGAVFIGGIHDYFSGMLSMRNGGKSIPEIVGQHLGSGFRQFMRAFTVILMILVGAVFITGPAEILAGFWKDTGLLSQTVFWAGIIVFYYVLATLLPIDKIIGRIYPIFGLAMLIMAVGILVSMIAEGYLANIPEAVPSNLINMKTKAAASPIFPMLFITIACGAISGFHSTQAPLMARCLTSEKYGVRVFYGAMITEGLVAMIWAAIAMAFFGTIKGLNDAVDTQNPASIVNNISITLMGKIGGLLAILGVVAAPITSGDTAFRSARLIVADFLKLSQIKISHRLLISIPLFIIGVGLTLFKFEIIWRYMAWANQTLATIVLWAITVYLYKERKAYLLAAIPAVFMTTVVTTYILMAPIGFGLSANRAMPLMGLITVFIMLYFGYFMKHLHPMRA
ncbi:MAG: carbon starvation protein A [Bacteroidales bacterium]|jgi:carbon starvation protein CstA|nr:carbon starvation protein A [Bacteroidales bacterium]NPV35563.1 carbon starvation protein A [Bacteroidales bacterium]